MNYNQTGSQNHILWNTVQREAPKSVESYLILSLTVEMHVSINETKVNLSHNIYELWINKGV